MNEIFSLSCPISIDYNGLEDYTSDPLVICSKSYLRKVTNVPRPREEKPEKIDEEIDETQSRTQLEESPFDYRDWYPYCNSYYLHSEQVDPFARVNHLLTAKPHYFNRKKCENVRKFHYSTQETQREYLESKPLSFLILGKPSIGQENLGKQLSDYWKCVFIDSETLIKEEIESGTRAGQCIEFNLRCGRAIGIDVILRLVEKRVKTESVQHRGFVLCGLPLIPNNLYVEDPVSSESAVFEFGEIFEETLDAADATVPTNLLVSTPSRVQTAEPSELLKPLKNTEAKVDWDPEESILEFEKFNSRLLETGKEMSDNNIPIDIGRSTRTIFNPPDISTNYEEQLEFILNLIEQPFMIIYMVCENQDVINKRADYRYDIYSETLIDVQREKIEKSLLALYSKQNRLGLAPDDPANEMFDNITGMFKKSSELVHPVKLPSDFPAHVQTQLQTYHEIASELIDALILTHDPEFVLRVDGRSNISRIFNSVKWKLRVANIQRVILPEKIIDSDALEVEGETAKQIKDLIFENWDKCMEKLSRKKIVNTSFKWELSDWGVHCPVAMYGGNFVEGQPKYAVHFMNYIFFLSSQQAFVKFYRNPRPYLLPPNPRSHGKIIVIGPSFSGKTAVSKTLGYFLNCTVLSPNDLSKKFILQKQENFIERIRQAMITEKLNRINLELERKHKLEKKNLKEKANDWLKNFKEFVSNENLKYEKISASKANQLELTSFPILLNSESVKTEEEPDEEKAPFVDLYLNEITVKDLVRNPEKMKKYVPEELRKEVPELIPETALDEADLDEIEEAVKNSDLEEIHLGEDDLLEMYVSSIKQVEEEYFERENIRGGWIIDGLTFDFHFFQRVLDECQPDHVIILKDSSENHEFLLKRFVNRGINNFFDYRNFFHSTGRGKIAHRVVDENPEEVRDKIIDDIFTDILGGRQFLAESGDPKEISQSLLLERRKSYTKFRTELKGSEETEAQIIDFLNSMKKHYFLFDIHDKSSTEELLEHVITSFENAYRIQAQVFTDMDRLQEAQEFGTISGNLFGEDGEGMNMKGREQFETNRKYGDFQNYCPITYHDKYVLWKGKPDHMAKFQGKLYFCSGEDDLNSFLKDPRKYITNKPQHPYPPPRICIVGCDGSGKTTMSKAISKNLSIAYIDFPAFLEEKGSKNVDSENYQVINEYLSSDSPLPDELLDEFLLKLWFEEPYKTNGIVLDDFPKRPSDITAMIRRKTIPDVVLCLKTPRIELLERVLEKGLAEWQTEMEKLRLEEAQKHLDVLDEWEHKREERFDQLMEERRQARFALKTDVGKAEDYVALRPHVEEYKSTFQEYKAPRGDLAADEQSKSAVTYNSVAEQEDMEEIDKILNAEFPQPVLESEIESIEDATKRIKESFFENYPKDLDFSLLMKRMCEEGFIPWNEINSKKFLKQTIYSGFYNIDKLKFRNESFFERTYEITIEIAEKLLSNGYFFLSIFGRTCPVQYAKQDVPIQLFIPMEQQFNVFPIVHRQYIYFVVGQDARKEFLENPLKYVDIENFKFPLIPIRIAVIGPPKCGKTSLSERFGAELGLKVVSKGQASRYVLNHLPYSELNTNMEIRLRNGLELKEKMVLSCVEACNYDPRAVTQGILFDGFPNSSKEVKYLASMGLIPHLIIDLYTDDPEVYETVLTNSLKQFEPPYSKHFMNYRYKIWESDQKQYRNWVDREYQNIVKMPIDTCMWDIYEKSYEYVKAAIYEVKHYFIHAGDDWPLRLANMLISPLEFMERKGLFKEFCPCCLYHDKKLTSGGFPPDRSGLVHFRKYFYWVCEEHIEEFLETPTLFLPPYNPNKIPPEYTEVLKLKELPENLHQSGYCTVCYKDSAKSSRGRMELAVRYGSRVYLFDRVKCMNTFLSYASEYCNVKVTLKDNIQYPTLDYRGLPPLGMLEQYVAKDITNALKTTASLRPILPGLSIKQSALITLAVLLKLKNKYSTERELEIHKKAWELLDERRKSLLQNVEYFKSHRNPFIYYEEPVPPLKISEWIQNKFGRDVPLWSYTDIKEPKILRSMLDGGDNKLPQFFDKVPAFLNVVDIAGLVKGASEGQGLGNAFLSHISACDAIFHLCRAFEDDDVTHVEGDVNPVRDLEIIDEELRLKDEETLNKALDKIGRVVERGADKKLKPEYDTLQKVKHVLVDEKNHIRFSDWDSKDIEILNKYLFLTSKPALYLVNLSEKDYIKKKNKWLIKIKEWVDKNDPGALIIPFSGAFEHKLVEEYDDPVLRKKFLEDNNVTSALDKIIVNGYKALQLEYFFTAGPDEVKAWTIQKGTKAPGAAGRIHTDFEKGFIMAEVMKFDDFKEEGSEAACKAAGKYRQQGRNYVVEDGDIIFFKFNAGAGLKDAKKK